MVVGAGRISGSSAGGWGMLLARRVPRAMSGLVGAVAGRSGSQFLLARGPDWLVAWSRGR